MTLITNAYNPNLMLESRFVFQDSLFLIVSGFLFYLNLAKAGNI